MDRTSYVFAFCIVFCLTTLFSCKLKDSNNRQDVFEKASKSDSLSYYFPSILSDPIEDDDPVYKDLQQKWYSSTLYSFKEPILYNRTDSQILYRLLWLRSFHRPVCFSMKQSNTSLFLKAQTLDRQPIFYPTVESKHRDEKTGRKIWDTVQEAERFALINLNKTTTLTSEQWNNIESYLSKIDFWNSPVLDPTDRDTDGSDWVLEGRKNGRYHFINRYNVDNNLMALGKYLIKLGGLDIKEDAIY